MDDIEVKLEFGEQKGEELNLVPVDANFDFHNADEHRHDAEEIEGVLIGAVKGGRKWEAHVVTIGNWPEFKTKTCYKEVSTPFGTIKVPYPCVWRRTCKKSWYLTITYNGSADLPGNIENILKDCAKIALVPAIPLLLVGQVGAAISAFLAAFKQCLIAKGIQEAAQFGASFNTRATHGEWKRV